MMFQLDFYSNTEQFAFKSFYSKNLTKNFLDHNKKKILPKECPSKI